MTAKYALWVLVACCAGGGLSGCGGEDEGEPRTAQQNCEDLLDLWCNKSAECVLPSERARAREDCRFTVELDIECTSVRKVGAAFSLCMTSVSESTCVPPGRIVLPSVCQGVLQN